VEFIACHRELMQEGGALTSFTIISLISQLHGARIVTDVQIKSRKEYLIPTDSITVLLLHLIGYKIKLSDRRLYDLIFDLSSGFIFGPP